MKPVLQALIVAERIWQTDDGRKIIAGTFDHISLRKRGSQIREVEDPDGPKKYLAGGDSGAPWAYISLTDVHNEIVVSLQFVNLKRNKVMFGTSLKIQCDNPLATVELVAPLPHLPVEDEGVYALEVVWQGEIIGSLRITASDAS